MKKIILSSLFLISLATAASAQEGQFMVEPVTLGKTVNGWTEVSDGFLLKKAKDVPGDVPGMGDFVELHASVRVGDSLMFSTRYSNKNMPVEKQIQPAQTSRYDLSDILQMMSVGDSFVVRMPLDTVLKNGAEKLPWMKEGMWFEHHIALVKITKQADGFKAKAAKGKAQMLKDEGILKEYFAKNNIKATRHGSGLYFKMLKLGTGDSARTGQKVTIKYTGRTLDGKAFDSNVDTSFQHAEPTDIVLGDGMVMPGCEIGIGLMKKGSKAIFYIPSPMAYGERSPDGIIPPNSPIIFEIEVVNIGKADPKEKHGPGDGHNH